MLGAPGVDHSNKTISNVLRLEPDSVFEERYLILKQIGEGGFGTLYKARHIELDRIVAIKLLRPELLGDRESAARFKIEGRILCNIKSPQVVLMYHFGVLKDQRAYIVMEYVKGISLTALTDSGTIAPRQAIKIAMQICDGLAAAHEQGIVHRDLKPSNVLILKSGDIKLIDFGLSRVLTSSKVSVTQHLTQTGLLIGSADYMSPEQCQGQKADHRSDLYSLGCLLFEMLTGKHLFEADSPIGLMHLHATAAPPELRASAGSVPAGLNTVLKKALQKNAVDRYQSAYEMKEDLQYVLNDEAHKIKPLPLLASKENKKESENKKPLSLLLFVLGIPLTAMLAVGYLFPAVQKEPERVKYAGVIRYLHLTRIDQSIFKVDEVHISPKGSASSPPITRLVGEALPTGQAKLVLGQVCTCTTTDGKLTKVQLENAYCPPVWNAWHELMAFYEAMSYRAFGKLSPLLGDKLPLSEVMGLYEHAEFMADAFGPQRYGLPGQAPYQERPLPQCVKVESWVPNETVFIVDESLIFSTRQQQCYRRMRMKFENGMWVLAQISTATADAWNAI